MKNSFLSVSASPNNSNWELLISRERNLSKKDTDIRSEFERDTNRIIHSDAYKRLKHKTQVFFSPSSDHVCTRIEHVNHVESISYSIANYLGLNTELTRAIAMAHDLGHAPFGHQGERILSKISEEDIGVSFWHEKNGLNVVDNIELLENPDGLLDNLNLTYAVRDGIISHCGEVDEHSIVPRKEYVDLNNYTHPNQFQPITWEACVVKIADKISYIIRDIEDAIKLHLLDKHLDELYELLQYDKSKKINNSNVINRLVYDICESSSPEKGITLSSDGLKLLDGIKKFNYEYIYNNPRPRNSSAYFELIITQIYKILKSAYSENGIVENLFKLKIYYPQLVENFEEWLYKYWNLTDRESTNLTNKIIFDSNNEKDYYRAIIYYISGMTDNFAINTYMEIIGF